MAACRAAWRCARARCNQSHRMSFSCSDGHCSRAARRCTGPERLHSRDPLGVRVATRTATSRRLRGASRRGHETPGAQSRVRTTSDSVMPDQRDHFRFVLASALAYPASLRRTGAASRDVRRMRSFESHGPTTARATASRKGAPGKELRVFVAHGGGWVGGGGGRSCELARRAAVRPRPVVYPQPAFSYFTGLPAGGHWRPAIRLRQS